MPDDICRECGGGLNCQHCHPVQLAVDQVRIANLEMALLAIIDRCEFRISSKVTDDVVELARSALKR